MSETPEALRLVPIPGLPEVEPGTDLAAMIRAAAEAAGVSLDGNVVVIAQKIVSKAEGRLVRLAVLDPALHVREQAYAEDHPMQEVVGDLLLSDPPHSLVDFYAQEIIGPVLAIVVC